MTFFLAKRLSARLIHSLKNGRRSRNPEEGAPLEKPL